MKAGISRRNLLRILGAAGIASARPDLQAIAKSPPQRWWLGHGMPQESAETPKIACGVDLGGGVTEHIIRSMEQIGVYHVLADGPQIPWTVEQLQPIKEKFAAGGIMLGNLRISGFPKIVYGQQGRDEEIEKVRQSIESAGKIGLPVVEYNFYAHRATEGYFDEIGRGGAGMRGADYDRMKDLPPLANEGAQSLTETWANITYFLKAVVPLAEKANVRLAVHPNDPPFPLSRGSQQILGTVNGWKHLISIVNSPSNGITFDCGVAIEMGENPVAICQYFGNRDRINHVHYRNPHVVKSYVRYDEGFIDEGDGNMLAVMRELVRQKYPRELYPEHPRLLDYDRECGSIDAEYAANVYDIAYAKAMLQAALLIERG